MIGMQPEREEDTGNSISAGGMQSEAQAGEGGREGRKWMVEGEKGAFWVECGQPLITSAGQIRQDSGTGPSDSKLSMVVVGGVGAEKETLNC